MLNPSQTSIPQGFTVVIIAIAIFKVYDYLTSRYNRFSKVIVPDPILLVKDGKIIDESMKKAKISKKELESYTRLSGTDDISDIKSSHLEINGQVSFVKKSSNANKINKFRSYALQSWQDLFFFYMGNIRQVVKNLSSITISKNIDI